MIPIPVVAAKLIPEHFPEAIAKEFTDSGMSVKFTLVFCSFLAVLVNNFQGLATIVKFYMTEKPKVELEGRGLLNLCIQVVNVLVLDILTFVGWHYAQLDSSNTAVMFVILVSGLAHGDLMFHILVTRVGLIPYPALLKSRGVWSVALLALVNYLHIAGVVGVTAVFVLRCTVLLGIVVSCLQYVHSMGNVIASHLGVNIFTIKVNTN